MRWWWLLALMAAGCDDDGAAASDAGLDDAAPMSDASLPDAEVPDTGAPDAAPPDAAPPDAAPPDAAPATVAEPCPRDEAGRCAAVTWTTSATVYPVPVDHHTTLIAMAGDQAWLTVIGGIESTREGGASAVYATVRRAPILADGDVGPFEDEDPLPMALAFHGQAVRGDTVYLVAGVSADAQGPAATSTYLVGTVGADGRVGGWREGELPREVRVHATVGVLGDRLYVVGGSGAQGAILDTVIVATLGPDGLPGEFTRAADLPAPRSHHALAVVDGRLFVAGGFGTGQRPAPDVWRSVHDATGALTGWEVAGHLDPAPWTSSVLVHRGWLTIVGGGEGEAAAAHFVDKVRAAPLQADGRLGPFEDVDAPLPLARSHVHQTPVHAGRVYSVGGRRERLGGLQSSTLVTIGQLW